MRLYLPALCLPDEILSGLQMIGSASGRLGQGYGGTREYQVGLEAWATMLGLDPAEAELVDEYRVPVS
jgi:hypothetical protein